MVQVSFFTNADLQTLEDEVNNFASLVQMSGGNIINIAFTSDNGFFATVQYIEPPQLMP